MSNQGNTQGMGLLASLSTLSTTIVAMLYTRLDLLSIDLEEERAHAMLQLVLTLAALFFMGVSVVLVSILLAVFYWDTQRIEVLAILAGSFFVAGMITIGFSLHKMHTKPRLFASSLSELDKDKEQHETGL